MLTLDARCRAVIICAYARLPKKHLYDAITSIEMADLGAHNGEFNSLSGRLRLNYRLFDGITSDDIPLIDDMGNFEPKTGRIVSRALHTTIHEMAHAIGEKTGLDQTPEWFKISGWANWPYGEHPDMPPYFGRYFETRPGWDHTPSEWVFHKDSWFTREYASKSPYEDFADCMAMKALGWELTFGMGHGLRKLNYIENRVYGLNRLSQSVHDRHTGAVMSADLKMQARRGGNVEHLRTRTFRRVGYRRVV